MSAFIDRTLVVSGSGSGIGLAFALGAAKQGANVCAAGQHPILDIFVDKS